MQDLGYVSTFVATATGTVNISAVNSYVRGILFTGTGTGKVQLFAGTTSTGAAAALGAQIVAYATVTGATANSAVYFPFPAYASGGLTMVVGGSADPKLTLFWNPA